MKTAVFKGRRYRVEIHDGLDGYVDLPGNDNPVLHVNRNLRPQKFLEVAIHEALHAALMTEDEKVVDPAALEIARFLWRLGYRRQDVK